MRSILTQFVALLICLMPMAIEAVADDKTAYFPAILLLLEDDRQAIPQEPEIAWADSYSSNGQCYCASDFDGGAGDKKVDTPYGEMTVRQACAEVGPGPDIESVGVELYNDVQCGNGPANNETNETFCPARVDDGKSACTETGPTWVYPDPIPIIANPDLYDFDNGPLQNPLKGFHLGFFASCCPDSALQEVYFGNYMASVGYQNFKWADLEPLDDQWDWDRVETELAFAGSNQKHVIVQLNAEWDKGDRAGRTPQWFIDNVTEFEENVGVDLSGNVVRSHKYESAYYQEEVKEFIAEFVNRYKDDPRIFIIQMGMVGYFGEFNVFPNDDIWLPDNIKTLFFEHYRDHVFGEVERNSSGDLVAVPGSGAGGVNSESYNGSSALTQVRYPAEVGYNVPSDGIGYTNGWVNLDGIAGDMNNDDDIGNKDFNDPISQPPLDPVTLLPLTGEPDVWTYGPVGGEWPPNREPAGDIIEEINGQDQVVVTGADGVIQEWTSFWNSAAGEDYFKRGHYSFARPPQVDTISRILERETLTWRLIPENWNRFARDAKEVGNGYSDGAGGDRFRKIHRMMGYNYQLSNIQHFFVADKSRISISFDVDNVGLAAFHFDWDVELAILDADNNVLQLIPIEDADMRTWKPDGTVNSVLAIVDLSFDIDEPGQSFSIGLRMLQPGATDQKGEVWKLDAKLSYVTISNNVPVIEGTWNVENQLVGGWNILDNID